MRPVRSCWPTLSLCLYGLTEWLARTPNSFEGSKQCWDDTWSLEWCARIKTNASAFSRPRGIRNITHFSVSVLPPKRTYIPSQRNSVETLQCIGDLFDPHSFVRIVATHPLHQIRSFFTTFCWTPRNSKGLDFMRVAKAGRCIVALQQLELLYHDLCTLPLPTMYRTKRAATELVELVKLDFILGDSKQDCEPCPEPMARGDDDGVSTAALALEDRAALQGGQTWTELAPEGQGRAERRSR